MPAVTGFDWAGVQLLIEGAWMLAKMKIECFRVQNDKSLKDVTVIQG